MSEYVEFLIFKNNIPESDVLNVALAYCKDKLENHIPDVIEENLIYLPCMSTAVDTYRNNGAVDLTDMTRHDKRVLESLFSSTFIYWKRYQMLAVLGNRKEKTAFAVSPIVFQNSVDRNEDYEVWDAIIGQNEYLHNDSRKGLKELRDRIIAGEEDENIHNSYDDDKFDEDEDPFISNDMDGIDYYRKEFLYDYVESDLHIIEWLYSNVKGDDLISFSMSDFRVKDFIVPIMEEAVRQINNYYKNLINMVNNT